MNFAHCLPFCAVNSCDAINWKFKCCCCTNYPLILLMGICIFSCIAVDPALPLLWFLCRHEKIQPLFGLSTWNKVSSWVLT